MKAPVNLHKKSMAKYSQGMFKPMNPKKYRGKFPIIFRSSWEAQVFKWCDRNDNIIEWNSESTPIPYVHPIKKKKCVYFPDLWIKLRDNSGNIKNYIAEVKPKAEVPEEAMKRYAMTNRKPSIQRQTILIVNHAKFESARRWCMFHNMEFVILTEDHIKVPKNVLQKKTNMDLARGKNWKKKSPKRRKSKRAKKKK